MRRCGVLGAAVLVAAAAQTVAISGPVSAASQARHATAAKAGHPALPVGPATGFPFGYVMDSGVKISRPPSNAADVNQAAVIRAPKVGPFRINLAAGERAWPEACALTSAAQLHALFPAILGFKGKPVGARGQNLGTGSNTPHNVQCKFNLRTRFDPAGYGATPSWVQVNIEEVDTGAPSQYALSLRQQAGQAKKFPAQYANYPALRYGVHCFYDGNELQCLKGDFSYWISGQKVTGGSDTSTDQAVWIDQIELPLAERIGAEVTTVG